METPDAVGEVNDTDGTASAPGLIDWETALETAARLSRTHRADTDRSLAAAVARVEAEVPVFRNKDYPLSPCRSSWSPRRPPARRSGSRRTSNCWRRSYGSIDTMNRCADGTG
ncbi:hypothetical protein LUX05_18820 [Streptomyces somaliensis]|nr:hypothetical protein [Streptomyces somaliensis]